MSFRLLRYTRMRLDTINIITILVSPNNSGKTSAIGAVLTLLQKPIKQLSVNGFSLGCHDALKKSEQYVLAPPATATPVGGEAAIAAPSPLPSLPVLSLRLKSDYDGTGPDLAITGELLTDLGGASALMMVETRFASTNLEQLAQTYPKDRDDDQSLFDYLAAILHNHCKLDQFKLSPDDSETERLFD